MTTIIVLSLLGLASLFTGVFNQRRLLLPLVITGILAGLGIILSEWNTSKAYFNDMLLFDNYAIAFTALLSVVTIVIFFLCNQYYSTKDTNLGDIYGLIIFTLVGAVQMVSYHNLAMLFIGVETLSISLYVLAGSRKLNLGSNEAALKYFLMGAFSTGFLLFGIALMYGLTGSFHLVEIKRFVVDFAAANPDQNLPLIFKAGILLMLVGMLFKVSAVPFHFWAPDVYHGAPTIITTFMATVVKTTGFAALFRLFYICFGGVIHEWFITVWVVTALTIVLGNISAVVQKNVKRMLAYSSIANAGYLLMGVLALNENAASAMLYYTAAYSLASVCAFGVLMAIELKYDGNSNYDAFKGLAKSNPLLAGIMTLAMLSLAGIPPLAGFFAKYYIFANSVENAYYGYIWLVVIAVLASLVGVYYYFKVIVAMFTQEPQREKIELKPAFKFILIASALALLVLGIFPGLLTRLL